MMEPRILDTILVQLRDALEHSDLTSAVKLIESLRPSDQAEVFSELDDTAAGAEADQFSGYSGKAGRRGSRRAGDNSVHRYANPYRG
jgi:hypothetical protein